jgi:hypothetical protein
MVFATPAANAGCPICSDSCGGLWALIHSLRLSLMKGAHADLASAAWQEIRVEPCFWLEWDHGSRVPLPVGPLKRALAALLARPFVFSFLLAPAQHLGLGGNVGVGFSAAGLDLGLGLSRTIQANRRHFFQDREL